MPRKRPIQDCESLIDWLIKYRQLEFFTPEAVRDKLRSLNYHVDIDVIKKTMVRAKAKAVKLDADRRLRSMATSVNKSERIRQVLASEQGLTPAEVRDRLAEQNVYVTIDLIKTVRRNPV